MMRLLALQLLLLLVMDINTNHRFTYGFSHRASIASPHHSSTAHRLTTTSTRPRSNGCCTNALLLNHHRSDSRHHTSVLNSAKILPITYASASVALVYQAAQAASVNKKGDVAVLIATSALALFNLCPTDNARLASAKRADMKHPPATGGAAKQRRQAAKTWRSTVRIKIVGQLLGLAWMASTHGAGIGNSIGSNGNSYLRGGAMIIAANMAFFLCGGGGAVHDANGDHTPMPSGLTRSILMIDTILVGSALLAASSPVGASRRAVYVGIYVIGVGMGALEGVAGLLKGFTAAAATTENK